MFSPVDSKVHSGMNFTADFVAGAAHCGLWPGSASCERLHSSRLPVILYTTRNSVNLKRK